MNKSKLTPQDGDLFAMIREITKVDIVVNEKPGNYEIHVCVEDLPKETTEALTAAVAGRLGKRFISNETDGTAITYFCQYGDWKNYPEEIRTDEMPITPIPGTRYCRTLKEVDAIKVDRERLEDLQKFTGGGTMTIPRTPGAIAKYEFKDNHGIILTAPEFSYIVREESGKIYVMDYRKFIRDFESKTAFIVIDDIMDEKKPTPEQLKYWFERLPQIWEEIQRGAKTLFDSEFGTDIFSRFRKLKEEYNETTEAFDDLLKTPGMFDDENAINHLIDEVGDLQAVLFHIQTILGTNPKALLTGSMEKVVERKTNPNFKRFVKESPATVADGVNQWEKADKTFDQYPDGTKANGTAGEIWVKVPGGWKDEKTGKVDPHLGANWTGEILIPSKMNEEPE